MRWSVSPTRVPDWNWNWTAVRPERYIFLNILVTVRDRLVTQPCHLPATTHYVPTTLPGYVAGHGRAVPTLYVSPIYTRDFLTSSFSFSFKYIYIYLPSGGASSPRFPSTRKKPSGSPLPRKRLSFYGIIAKILGGEEEGERERDWIGAAIVTNTAIPIPGKTISIGSS